MQKRIKATNWNIDFGTKPCKRAWILEEKHYRKLRTGQAGA
jgi:hypothetical protein